jgi:hypothetical protein
MRFLTRCLPLLLTLIGLAACATAPSESILWYDDIQSDEQAGGYQALSKWPDGLISFAFQNGTDHLSGDREKVLVRAAFDLWAAEAGLTFEEIADPAKADIMIAWYRGNHNDGDPFDGAGGVLAHATFPNPYQEQQVIVHFDDSERWVDSTSADVDLLTVAAHEIGHALGLGHSSDYQALMFPRYLGPNRSLGQDDIAGALALYGPQIVVEEAPESQLANEDELGRFLTTVIEAEISAFAMRSSQPLAGLVTVELQATIQSQIDDLNRQGLVQISTIDFANSYIVDVSKLSDNRYDVSTCEIWTTRWVRRADGSLVYFSGPELVPQRLTVAHIQDAWQVVDVEFYESAGFCRTV